MIKYSIEEMRRKAKERLGHCLSSKYVNSKKQLKWQCQKGHIWEMSPEKLPQGRWCPFCSGTRKSIEYAHNLAVQKEGKCLSTVYANCKSKLLWQCSEEHQWEATLDNIQQGKWCPICAHINSANSCRKYSIEYAQKTAQQKGGKCLSSIYTNVNSRLKWQCSNNHEWNATLASIQRGSWCPYCSLYFTENKCRFIVESLTKHEFIKCRLVLDNKFELDGYCAKLKTAFEFNGMQHYLHVKRFHKTKDAFRKQQKRDVEKRLLCKRKGIRLLTIPYWANKSDRVLVRYIQRLLHITNFVDMKKFYKTFSPLLSLNRIASKKNGKILSTEYVNQKTKIKCECSKGHIWKTAADNIQQGRWCPVCAKNGKYSITDMQSLANSRSGKCISTEYLGANERLEWECEFGHRWKTTPSSVMNGRKSWCPICWEIRRKASKHVDDRI